MKTGAECRDQSVSAPDRNSVFGTASELSHRCELHESARPQAATRGPKEAPQPRLYRFRTGSPLIDSCFVSLAAGRPMADNGRHDAEDALSHSRTRQAGFASLLKLRKNANRFIMAWRFESLGLRKRSQLLELLNRRIGDPCTAASCSPYRGGIYNKQLQAIALHKVLSHPMSFEQFRLGLSQHVLLLSLRQRSCRKLDQMSLVSVVNSHVRTGKLDTLVEALAALIVWRSHSGLNTGQKFASGFR